MQRRDFCKTGLLAGAGLFVPARSALSQNTAPLARFVDPLPIPTVLSTASAYTITMNAMTQKLHRDLPPGNFWGYNSQFIGPTIVAASGQPVSVNWVNNLPGNHIFAGAIDTSLHGAEAYQPQVRNIVHLHGAKVVPVFDGYPDMWFTPGNSRIYHYPNDQPATQLWYHDHAIGITRLNVYAGLFGLYLIRDNFEQSSGLPMGLPYEIPLVIVDRWLESGNSGYTGNFLYPTPANQGNLAFRTAGVSDEHPIWATEVWADTPLVNGKIYPYLTVEPRVYRFRILNASNSRFFNLSLKKSDQSLLPLSVIGADQGFLPQPVQVSTLLVANAERYDVIVDFSGCAVGSKIIMANDGPAPYPGGGGGPDISEIMQFQVIASSGNPTFSIPSSWPAAQTFTDPVVFYRDIRLDEIEDNDGDELRDPALPPNSFPESEAPVIGLMELKHWGDPATVKPRAGSTEIWRFINVTPDTHPIHVHLVKFRVLDRQQFQVDKFKHLGAVDFTDPVTGLYFPVMPADPLEQNAPKDVVRVERGTVTRVEMTFDLPTGTVIAPGNHLQWIYHCHILEHEDNEMMRPFQVVGAPAIAPVTTDVSSSIKMTASGFTLSRLTHTYNLTIKLTNSGSRAITGPLQFVFQNLTAGVTLANANGSYQGAAFLTVPGAAALGPGQSVSFAAQFNNPAGVPITFTPQTRSGSF